MSYRITEIELCRCGAKPGEPHNPGLCEHEVCPFCYEQLIGCSCMYFILKLDPTKEPKKGFGRKVLNQWDKTLSEKGLVPYGMSRAEKNRRWLVAKAFSLRVKKYMARFEDKWPVDKNDIWCNFK